MTTTVKPYVNPNDRIEKIESTVLQIQDTLNELEKKIDYLVSDKVVDDNWKYNVRGGMYNE